MGGLRLPTTFLDDPHGVESDDPLGVESVVNYVTRERFRERFSVGRSRSTNVRKVIHEDTREGIRGYIRGDIREGIRGDSRGDIRDGFPVAKASFREKFLFLASESGVDGERSVVEFVEIVSIVGTRTERERSENGGGGK